jgi:hypothetical protein
MSEAYSVSTGGEGQHKCARCKTYIESYDLMLGVSSITFGIKGTEMWRHLDCTDQAQIQAVIAEGEEFIPDHLAVRILARLALSMRVYVCVSM